MDSDEDDQILLLTIKLRCLVKKRGNYKSSRFKSKEGKEIKDKIVCYGCKKPRHFKSECPDRVEEKEERKKKKKFSKKKKSLMSTWEDWDSSSFDSEEEANIGLWLMWQITLSDDSNNEVDFTDIDSLHLAYHETVSNNGMIASAYKTMKRNYKNACKEIELMQQEKARLNDIYLKITELLQRKEKLCNENRNLKRDFVIQNTHLKNLEKELVLIRKKK